MFTLENTEGFTQSDLNMLNAVAERIVAECGLDVSNIQDVLNNVWVKGITESELETRAQKRLGTTGGED